MFDSAPTVPLGRVMLHRNLLPAASPRARLMKPTGTNPQADTRSTWPNGSRWVGLCMLLGLALLAAGCWEGVAYPQGRTSVLMLLTGGIAMFVVALVLLCRKAVRHMAAPMPLVVVDPDPVSPAIAVPPQAVLPEAQTIPLLAGDVEPAACHASGSTIVAGDIAVTPKSPEAAFDVTTLMGAPLSDLLLAAMCKDAVGARRIFAKALESQPDSDAQLASTTLRSLAHSPTLSKTESPAVASGTTIPVSP